MIITPRDDLAAIPLVNISSPGRSGGTHVSGLIRRIMQRLEPSKYSDDGGPDTARMALGVAYEEALEQSLSKHWGPRVVRPGEVERDGIVGSPAGIDLEEERLDEIKLTWMKYEPDLDHPKYWKWLVQVRAYLAMLGWTRARLWIFFVNGDYRGSGPLTKVFDLEFTIQETEETWQMLLRETETDLSSGSGAT